MRASKSREFAVITWKTLPRQHDDFGAFGTKATCGHDDENCPRITADVLIREGSCIDAAQDAEHWDGELTLLDPIVCTCARW
jgi:hypothetical protein